MELTPEQKAERAKKRQEEMASVPVLPRQEVISNPKHITIPNVSVPAVDPNPKSRAAIVQKVLQPIWHFTTPFLPSECPSILFSCP